MSEAKKYVVSTYHFSFGGGCSDKEYVVTAYTAEDAWFQVKNGDLRCSDKDYVIGVKPYSEPDKNEPEIVEK